MYRWGAFKEFLLWNLFIIFLFHSLKSEASAFDCPTLFEKAVAHMRRVREERKYQDDLMDDLVIELKYSFNNYNFRKSVENSWSKLKPIYKAGKYSVKTLLYPYIFMIRIPQVLIRTPHLVISQRNPHFFYLYPFEILKRDSPKITAYFALSAIGINIFESYVENHDPEKDVTYIEELFKAAEISPLKENERLVLISGNDKNIESNVLEYMTKAYPFLKDKIEIKSVNNNTTLISEIEKLKNSANVKYLLLLAHGSPGSMNFNLSSPLDISLISSLDSWDINKIRQVGNNIFTKDSKLIFLSCSISGESSGKEFIRNCTEAFQPPPNKTIASNLLLSSGETKESVESFKDLKKSFDNLKKESGPAFMAIYGIGYPMVGSVLFILHGPIKPQEAKIFQYESPKIVGDQSKVP